MTEIYGAHWNNMTANNTIYSLQTEIEGGGRGLISSTTTPRKEMSTSGVKTQYFCGKTEESLGG